MELELWSVELEVELGSVVDMDMGSVVDMDMGSLLVLELGSVVGLGLGSRLLSRLGLGSRLLSLLGLEWRLESSILCRPSSGFAPSNTSCRRLGPQYRSRLQP